MVGGGGWLESEYSDRLWLSFSLALAKPNNTRKESFDLEGGFRFSLKYFSLLILRLCIDFKLLVNPGTIKKVCGGCARLRKS